MITFAVTDKKTGKEPNLEQIALNEEWAKDLVYCDISGFVITEDGCLMMMDDTGVCRSCPSNRFEITVKEIKE